ncbi:MAG: deoxyribose-phosphate aldolase [Clostridiales bacterium]|nr:deoxyribose-phosphate aldolase [Clostridiales bacterium]
MDSRVRLIDHTILKPYATEKEVEKYCDEAIEYGFCSVCVNPYYVRLVANKLKGTDVKVCTVIGFPLGANMPEVKAYETRLALRDGAQEIDMVINIGALKQGNVNLVRDDIAKVVKEAKGNTVKVIIETCYLTDEEKRIVCKIAKEAGAQFVKTSTGFGTNGATSHDVALMREVVGEEMGVKASGGIRTAAVMEEMIKAGASRIGTSNGVDLL